MVEPARDSPKRSRDLFGLLAFITLCLAVSGGGGAITATSVDTWYQALEKPPFNPPDWLFAPVWTTLYILMGIAAWRVWRLRSFEATRMAFAVFGAQLCLNLAWSFLFFALQRIDLALLEIIILLIAIITNTIVFWRIERLAGLLFVPYAVWVTYATILNAALWLLNAT
ncbi:MAG: TspO protein [Rhodospirillaceae bacterium]|nr:TspO protein [Rhodospirillaceae bacterium]|tara:strand:+ start:5494 stop:6000 length:507 start_codon:yes stop_codon:yes gene_type:complete